MLTNASSSGSLHVRRRRIAGLVLFYFVAGSISQKVIPGIDEVFPFFGWSLFSHVPNLDQRYEVLIHGRAERHIEPPEPYLKAPAELVRGNEHLGRKLIQRFGQALESGDSQRATQLRRLFERNYLASDIRYEVVLEHYRPLEKWRTGRSDTVRSLGTFAKAAR